MELPTLDENTNIESLIRKMKKDGYITEQDLINHFSPYLYSTALTRMLHDGLIVKNVDNPWMYVLTEKGRNFKGFQRGSLFSRQMIYKQLTKAPKKILIIIEGILIGLLVAYLVYRFGWNH